MSGPISLEALARQAGLSAASWPSAGRRSPEPLYPEGRRLGGPLSESTGESTGISGA